MCSAAAENQLTDTELFGLENNNTTIQATTTFAGVVERGENLFRETKSGGSAGGNQAISDTTVQTVRDREGKRKVETLISSL